MQTTYLYDALNRLTKKTYNDGGLTPTVQFGYDAGTLSGCKVTPPAQTDSYPIGRRTSMCDGSGGTSLAHDKLGRLFVTRRQVASASARSLTYTYNLDGSLATQYDGTGGKTITYTTGAGRASTRSPRRFRKHVRKERYVRSVRGADRPDQRLHIVVRRDNNKQPIQQPFAAVSSIREYALPRRSSAKAMFMEAQAAHITMAM